MIQRFHKQRFDAFLDRGGRVFSDLEFDKCEFIGCAVSITKNPATRTSIRNITLTNCGVTGCNVDTAIVEDTLVDNLKTHGLFACWGAAFNRVTLRGRMGNVMINSAVATGTASAEEQRAFDEANAAYYRNVDWALDVSEAEFFDADIRGVPARLIRRDPETQAVVTKHKAMEGTWRRLDLSKTWWAASIEFLLNRPYDADVVLVAPKRHKRYRDLLDGIKMLRDEGIAEPE